MTICQRYRFWKWKREYKKLCNKYGIEAKSFGIAESSAPINNPDAIAYVYEGNMYIVKPEFYTYSKRKQRLMFFHEIGHIHELEHDETYLMVDNIDIWNDSYVYRMFKYLKNKK